MRGPLPHAMAALPIDSLKADFMAALEAAHVVVEAPTGSGKSTRLPLWCAERGRVLVVEPRRLACRALARHVADSQQTELGDGVGYAVRFDARHGPDSRVVFVTPGVALRWLADGGLPGYVTVVLDEFHERRWDTDLLAALLRRADRHRLVVTSATVAGERLARYLEGRCLRSEGHTHPVTVSYTEERDLPSVRGLEKRVCPAVQDALCRTSEGDVLVFLPGRSEIQAVRHALDGRVEAETIPLHAGVEVAVQDRALAPACHRRVILATNVAETSLTIPGARAVVDSGLERRTHHRNGRTVLSLHAISDAAAQQRCGRAGRLAPGVCIRLWGHQARLEAFTPPEVLREELTELFLASAASGVPATTLEFPDPLPAHAVKRAQERLAAMQALDESELLTEHGRRLFPLPLDPLFAHLIAAMTDATTRAAMVDLAAALTVGHRLLSRPLDRELIKDWVPEECDATTLVTALRREPPPGLTVDTRALAEARQIADQTRAALGLPARTYAEPVPRLRLLRLAIQAVPELAFVRRAKRRQALGNGGSEVEVGAESRYPSDAEAAVVFDQHSVPARGTQRTINYATCMAPVPLAELMELGLGRAEAEQPRWDGNQLIVAERQVYAGRTIGARVVKPVGAAARHALSTLVLERGLKAPAGERLRADVEAWNLYVELGRGEGDQQDARDWLEHRLASLGVENGEDMALIEPEDLVFPGIPPWERARFDRHHPRELQLENLHVAVSYEPRKRRITLQRRNGTRRTPPMPKELPAWPGWSVRYRDGSRLVDVR